MMRAWQAALGPDAHQAIRLAAEKAKLELSSDERTTLKVDLGGTGAAVESLEMEYGLFPDNP